MGKRASGTWLVIFLVGGAIIAGLLALKFRVPRTSMPATEPSTTGQ
jgi:hypothetical protein